MADARGRGRDVFIVCNNVEEMGGVQQWAHGLARLMSGRGHRVILVGITRAQVPHDFGGPYGEARPYKVEHLHETWTLPALPWRPRTFRARADVRARLRDGRRAAAVRRGAERLSELFAGARPGGVVIVAQVWAMEWVDLARTRGLRVVGMCHESYQASRRSSRYARVRELYAGADRMLALTAEDADAWARDGMANADHMPNALHVRPGSVPAEREPVVVCVGRLAHEKGVDLAIEAWAAIAERHPEWRLRLYGTGPREDDLRAQAARLGVAGSVEFAGVTADVPGALGRASVFALPSRQEGLPMALLEAMAAGLPAVAFDCAPGVRDLVADGRNGLLVRAGDTAAFAAELERLITDPALRARLGGEAPRAVRRFDPEAVLDRWEWLFGLLHRGLPPLTVPPPAAPRGATAPALGMDPVRDDRLDL
ncbi:glycosyltransferase [Spirillospora sp. NPDC029432]|uniref:glycosyltransferase n=1 Tax=Spirillospora sp. NPDC029432 TaxID=3154599 RepID=UPI003456B557